MWEEQLPLGVGRAGCDTGHLGELRGVMFISLEGGGEVEDSGW